MEGVNGAKCVSLRFKGGSSGTFLGQERIQILKLCHPKMGAFINDLQHTEKGNNSVLTSMHEIQDFHALTFENPPIFQLLFY